LNELRSYNSVSGTPNNLSNSFEKPLAAALKAILSSAKNPKAGIDLSVEVLKAVEKA